MDHDKKTPRIPIEIISLSDRVGDVSEKNEWIVLPKPDALGMLAIIQNGQTKYL